MRKAKRNGVKVIQVPRAELDEKVGAWQPCGA